MNDALMRQWAMLRALPRFPRRTDAPALRQRLSDLGMDVSLRTVQRDLITLATTFPLESDESKPQGWCWREGAAQLEIPSMDAHAALTFNLVEQYMQNLLPRSTLEQLTPWFTAAQGVASSQVSHVTDWQRKLRVIPHAFSRITTQIDPGIQTTVYNGLLREQQLEVTYRALSSNDAAKTYAVHPLGMVVMEQVVYLVCTVKQYEDARFLAMHRIDAATLLEAPARQPKSFDIDAFISREFGIRMGDKPLNLKLRIRGVLAKYLRETPVAKDQSMMVLDGEWSELTATVPDTVQLRMWLRSLGASAEVREPASLRMEMRKEFDGLLSLYES